MRRGLGLGVVVLALAVVVHPGDALPEARDVVAARVLDAHTRAPISEAIVTVDGREIRTDAGGWFEAAAPAGPRIGVRAYGYGRVEVAAATLRGPRAEVALEPVRPKALYLSMFGIASRALRRGVLDLADTTEINAVVIDVKGDRGLIAFPRHDSLASAVGAQKTITITDLPALAASLHDRHLYLIARIVVFKDDRLATGRPDLAVHRSDGSLFRDREGLAWSNPDRKSVV